MTATLTERAQSFGHLFVDRVGKTPNGEAFRYRVGDDWTVTDLGADQGAGVRARRRAGRSRCAAAATGRHRRHHPDRVDPVRPGDAVRRAPRRPPSTPPPPPPTSPTSSATPNRWWCSPRTRSRPRRPWRRHPPCLRAIVLFDGSAARTSPDAGDVSRVLDPGRARRARPAAACRRTGRGRQAHRRLRPGGPGHPDLHLRHHRPAQGCPAGARQLDVRGQGRRGAEHPRSR